MTRCTGLHGCGGHGLTVAVVHDAHGRQHHLCAGCVGSLGWLVHDAGDGFEAQVVVPAEVRIVRKAAA